MKKKQTIEMKNITKKNNGITLIALVITVIVLLILAGVTIATLTGDNGIFSNASKAREQTEIANVIEQAKTDVLGIQTENEDGNITKGELKTVLDKYFDVVPDDYTTETVLTTKDEYGNHEIAVSEIYNGNLGETQEVISKTESYVGYYADIDGNGSVDGIIYADLAKGNIGSGQWGNEIGIYEIPKVESGLKEYSISETMQDGPFGPKYVISPEESGNPRFYVMALEDIGEGTAYWWYAAAIGKLDKLVSSSEKDFGAGKENTAYVMAKWNLGTAEGGWGTQNAGSYDDMWGAIKDQVNEGWFVPSKSEWAAFGGELGITTSNYPSYGLRDWYWSSSQATTDYVYYASFDNGSMYSNTLDTNSYVRLSTTF